MLNLVIWYSSTWQGWALEHWGYPMTLSVDAAAGLACLAALAFVRPRRGRMVTLSEGESARRPV